MHLPSIVWLSWKEYWRSFAFPKAPGNRDFLWLTFLVGFIIGLALVLISVQDGLLEKHADSLLGKVENQGYPIAIRADTARPQGIDRSVLATFSVDAGGQVQPALGKAAGLRLHPYELMEEGGQFALVNDPLVNASGSLASVARKMAAEHGFRFRGWAVYRDDPLWRWAHRQTGKALDTQPFPLRIVLSRHSFQQFDYEEYRKAVLDRIPAHVAHGTLPDRKEDLRVLWLIFNHKGPIVPAEVLWVDSIPSPLELAFLFPLETLHAATAALHLPTLTYHPEPSDGGDTRRVARIKVFSNHPSADGILPEVTGAIGACLGGAAGRPEGDSLQFLWPLPASWVARCVETTTSGKMVQVRPIEAPRPDPAWTNITAKPAERGWIRVPCHRLRPQDQRHPGNAACNAQHPAAKPDPTPAGWFDAAFHGFRGAVVYVADRRNVHDVARTMANLHDDKGPLFWLDPTYEAALNKVQYLSRITEYMSRPTLFAAIAFALYLMANTMKLVLDHRKANYGTLVANGVSSGSIRLMLLFQLALTCIVGGTAFGVIQQAIKSHSNTLFADSDVAVLGRSQLGITDTVILPLSTWRDVVMVGGGVYILAALILLFITAGRLSAKSGPTDLLK